MLLALNKLSSVYSDKSYIDIINVLLLRKDIDVNIQHNMNCLLKARNIDINFTEPIKKSKKFHKIKIKSKLYRLHDHLIKIFDFIKK